MSDLVSANAAGDLQYFPIADLLAKLRIEARATLFDVSEVKRRHVGDRLDIRRSSLSWPEAAFSAPNSPAPIATAPATNTPFCNRDRRSIVRCIKPLVSSITLLLLSKSKSTGRATVKVPERRACYAEVK